MLGNGSNDILELATLAYLRPGEAAVYSQHAFAVYPLATQARGARGIEVPARDLGHDLPAMRAAITPDTRIVFVANPNNPTGTFIAPGALEAFIASVPRDVLVVLDEAYNEYLEPAERADSVGWLARYPHLARLPFVLEGVRSCGAAHRLRRDACDGRRHVQSRAAAVQRQLARAGRRGRGARRYGVRRGEPRDQPRRTGAAVRGLEALDVDYVRSHGNFVLVKVGDAARINHALLAQGVIVRPVASYGLPECLRVSVGLPAENERFLAALETALGR